MTFTTVTQSIEVSASSARVWAVLVAPDAGTAWRGADFDTDWQVGSPIAIAAHIGTKTYHDKAEVLAFEPAERLRYSYWSRISGLPDTPEGRSIITIRLTAQDEGTLLQVEQQVPSSPIRVVRGETIGPESGQKHVVFYWRSTLHIIKRVAEAA
jgi:uncharacterized protein YndB with AHSA1/START domain